MHIQVIKVKLLNFISAELATHTNIKKATKFIIIFSFIKYLNLYENFIDKSFFLNSAIIDSFPIIKGDQKSLSIACASIIAKETRDEIMLDYHKKYPQYGFDKHAGYGTKAHFAKIQEFGITSIHRKSFAGVVSRELDI